METNAPAKKNNRMIVILLVIIILLLIAVLAVFLLRGSGGGAGTAQSVDASTGKGALAYANQGVTVIDDQNALQAAVDEMMEKAEEGNVALRYQNTAFSSDGKVFSCSIGNSEYNTYDMYIDIYSDLQFTDQLFLSGLIRPGEEFQSIELTRALEPGDHTVYCAFTQVEEDLETIHAQVVVTMTFTVQ